MSEAALAEAVIPAAILVGLLDVADRHEVLADPWLAGTGLTTDQLGRPDARVSFRQAAAVVRRALAALPDGPVGMWMGSRDALTSFGILGFALRSARTGAEALQIGLEMHQAAGSMVDAEVEFFADEFALRLLERAPEPAILPFLCEEAYASTLLLIRTILGIDVHPTRLELAFPRPHYARDYDRFFRCPIQYDADANRLFLSSELLDRPIPTHDPAHLAAALEATRRLIDPADKRPDTVAAVEGLLRENLRRPLSMADAAARLGVTERTLRRQLADSGHQFSAVRDGVRRDRATLLLRESTMRINEIAADVGFSDAREFRRAYQRWTGRAPTAERSPGVK